MGGQLWWAKCLSGNPPNFVFLLCAYASVVAMRKINFLSFFLSAVLFGLQNIYIYIGLYYLWYNVIIGYINLGYF